MTTLLYITNRPQDASLPMARVREAGFALRVEAAGQGRKRFLAAISEADAVLHDAGTMDAPIIECARRCRIIVRCGPGSTGLDIEAARRAGIAVSSVSDVASSEYAELTCAILRDFQSAMWKDTAVKRRKPRLGLIGLGQVGRAVAERALHAGYQVWATDPFVINEIFVQARARKTPLVDLFGICDVVSLHLPLGPDTRGMVSREWLGLMRPGSRLLNASHPDLVDRQALETALKKGRLAEAVMLAPKDFARFQAEGLRWIDDDFMDREEVRGRTVERAFDIVADYFRGVAPEHLLIDPPLPRPVPSLDAV